MQKFLLSGQKSMTGSAEIAAMAQDFYKQGSALVQSGHMSDALVCFHKARLISPRTPEILLAIANCLSDIGQNESASIYYLEALDAIQCHLQAIRNYDVSAGLFPGKLPW